MVLFFMLTACTEYDLFPERDQYGGLIDGTPIITVTPESHDFGEFSVKNEESDFITVTIGNIGDKTLYIEDLRLESNEWYDLGNISSVIIPPEDDVTVDINVQPDWDEDSTASLFIDSSDPESPTVEVPLLAAGIAPKLKITPENYDFGSLYVGCEDSVKLKASNEGRDTLNITAHRLEYNDDWMTLRGLNTLPIALEPEEEVELSMITYQPLDETSQLLNARTYSDDPERATVPSAINGLGNIYGTHTDNYEQPLHAPVDILFALDKSCSMDDDIANVKNNFETFVSTLSSLDSDYRVAAVVSDGGCIGSNVDWIDDTMNTNEQLNYFNQMVDSAAGRYTEAPLYLMSLAVNQSSGGCNNGFVREDADLALITVSDEPEQSPNRWDYYVGLFQTIKGDPEKVVIHSIAGDVPNGCGGNAAGYGHYEATVETGGVFLSICSYEFGSHLQALAEGSVSENKIFDLTYEPVPGTIEVKENNRREDDGWEYVGNGNYIAFNQDNIPEPGSQIEITYAIMPNDCD